MSRTNETRHIEWHETCKCKCRLDGNKTTNGGKEDKYGEYFMKIKFDADDNLPLNKLLKLHMLTILLGLFLKKAVNFIHNFI